MYIKSDLHIHSIRSGHAFNTIDECITYAQKIGIECIGIADHGPSMEGCPHLGYFEVLPRLPKANGNVDILYGCEANILDTYGTIDISDEVASDLDYVMVGLHKRTPYIGHSLQENTAALVASMHHNRIDIMAHPFREEFPVDSYDVIHCAKENGVLIEINKVVFMNAIIKGNRELIEQLRNFIKIAIDSNVMCLLGSDAHYKTDIGISEKEWKEIDTYYDIKNLNIVNDDILSILKKSNRIVE